MLGIKLIREQPEVVRENLKKRRATEKLKMLEDLIEYDKEWRRLLTEANKLRHKRKLITTEIASLKKKGKDVSKKLEEAQKIPEEIEKLEKKINSYQGKTSRILLNLPNILHSSVPAGEGEEESVVVKMAGELP